MSEQHIFWTNDPLEFVKQAKKKQRGVTSRSLEN